MNTHYPRDDNGRERDSWRKFDIEATKNLPNHDLILQAVLDFFYTTPGVAGCFLSGSMATLELDEDSDIDVGVVFQNAEHRESVWQKRWEWKITTWFHRFDADHIKPYFVIYFYEPGIQADINLYIHHDLPPVEGGPYRIVWDHDSMLNTWQRGLSEPSLGNLNWDGVVHEDERFWAWTFYVFRCRFIRTIERVYLFRIIQYSVSVRYEILPAFHRNNDIQQLPQVQLKHVLQVQAFGWFG